MNEQTKIDDQSGSTSAAADSTAMASFKAPTPELIAKYSVSGPRYTSYPTAVEFSSTFKAEEWKQSLGEQLAADSVGQDGGVSLYAHLPFCRTLCYFCACNKVISLDRAVVAPYISALTREFELFASVLDQQAEFEQKSRRRTISGQPALAGQLHWGGGTPNYLLPAELEAVFKAITSHFPLSQQADVSIEIDPRTTTRDQISTLAGLGFNRVSLGVQDFDPAVQEAINRIQSIECTEQVIDWAREDGFPSVNVDLVYGLPLQTLEGFSKTIYRILQIRPERIALYGYAHVTWLTKVQRTLEREHLPLPAERIALFLRAVELLTAAGYVHIGMDHFALPTDGLGLALESGTLNRNFMGYSTNRGSKIFGFGASSISTLDAAFAQNVKDVGEYQKLVAAGELPIERGLAMSTDDRLRAEVIQAVMCRGRIEFAQFEVESGIPFFSYFTDTVAELEDLTADGLIERDSAGITVTPLGRYFQRNIAMVFDAYLKRHRAGEKRIFSQAV